MKRPSCGRPCARGPRTLTATTQSIAPRSRTAAPTRKSRNGHIVRGVHVCVLHQQVHTHCRRGRTTILFGFGLRIFLLSLIFACPRVPSDAVPVLCMWDTGAASTDAIAGGPRLVFDYGSTVDVVGGQRRWLAAQDTGPDGWRCGWEERADLASTRPMRRRDSRRGRQQTGLGVQAPCTAQRDRAMARGLSKRGRRGGA